MQFCKESGTGHMLVCFHQTQMCNIPTIPHCFSLFMKDVQNIHQLHRHKITELMHQQSHV